MQEIKVNRYPGVEGDIGSLILNRPNALNALTEDMCIAIYDQLSEWETDDTIKAVIIESADDKAFCAGGDVVTLYQNYKKPEKSTQFFWHEYRMNAKIFNYKKPYIALMNGITMGGGVGVSGGARCRVATQNLLWAMPETGIGFFPDVGGGYYLSRLAPGIGLYLGLTGARLRATDAWALGLVDVVDSDQLAAIVQRLIDTPLANLDNHALTELCGNDEQPAASLPEPYQMLAEHFDQQSVLAIIQSLEKSDDEHAQRALAQLKQKSPTSLKLTRAQIQGASARNFNEEMEIEFNMAQACMQSEDFYEGVRAVLIDKDKQPNWQPSTLQEVAMDDITNYFEPQARSLFETV